MSKIHARRNPNLTIQSTGPYAQLSPALPSATSSAFLSPTVFSRRGLLSQSPPASPSLPSLVPRHGKKKTQPRRSRLAKRVLIACCASVLVLWLILRRLDSRPQQAASFKGEEDQEWGMIGDTRLPDEPTALGVQDAHGNMRWTVSIPSKYDFPLQPQQYKEICQSADEISHHLTHRSKANAGLAERILGYSQQDQHFIDIQEAQDTGLLPMSKATGRPEGFVADESIANGFLTTALNICERTLTYVMETEDVGFGNTLMHMWMSYGLAKAEKRTFFIDDTRWPYGKFKSFFQPPPTAGCLPPSKTHMVPCPRTAQHLVISAATAPIHFGATSKEQIEDSTESNSEAKEQTLSLLRTGFEALFHLRTDDATYISARVQELYGNIRREGGVGIGIHIRRGDKHPLEYQYQQDYIPLPRYVDAARDLYFDLVEGQSHHRNQQQVKTLLTRHSSSKMVIATDDPSLYNSTEFGPNTVRAQDHIVLATKAALEAAQPRPKTNWIDEVTGWEGGFYPSIFLSLGESTNNADATNKVHAKEASEQAMRLRELVGRAYLLDLAVLGLADAIVCTVSSTACKVLGVMLGEEKVRTGSWKNIDGSEGWSGLY